LGSKEKLFQGIVNGKVSKLRETGRLPHSRMSELVKENWILIRRFWASQFTLRGGELQQQQQEEEFLTEYSKGTGIGNLRMPKMVILRTPLTNTYQSLRTWAYRCILKDMYWLK